MKLFKASIAGAIFIFLLNMFMNLNEEITVSIMAMVLTGIVSAVVYTICK